MGYPLRAFVALTNARYPIYMPVVEWEPKDLHAPVIVAFSDASDNLEAVKEIDSWANEHGLVRARENWLAQMGRHNRMLFRGACYPAPEG